MYKFRQEWAPNAVRQNHENPNAYKWNWAKQKMKWVFITKWLIKGGSKPKWNQPKKRSKNKTKKNEYASIFGLAVDKRHAAAAWPKNSPQNTNYKCTCFYCSSSSNQRRSFVYCFSYARWLPASPHCLLEDCSRKHGRQNRTVWVWCIYFDRYFQFCYLSYWQENVSNASHKLNLSFSWILSVPFV